MTIMTHMKEQHVLLGTVLTTQLKEQLKLFASYQPLPCKCLPLHTSLILKFIVVVSPKDSPYSTHVYLPADINMCEDLG